MRWAGHVARMKDERNAYGILVGKAEVKNHLEDRSLDGKKILKRV
jgi:hypothetical protein